jgi:hypothetical protein
LHRICTLRFSSPVLTWIWTIQTVPFFNENVVECCFEHRWAIPLWSFMFSHRRHSRASAKQSWDSSSPATHLPAQSSALLLAAGWVPDASAGHQHHTVLIFSLLAFLPPANISPGVRWWLKRIGGIAITQPAVFSNHTGCAALAIKEKQEIIPPPLPLPAREKEREKVFFLSRPSHFPVSSFSFRPLFSSRETMQKKLSLQ